MKILIANMSAIPVYAYGGTERVIWDLAKQLVNYGHEVTFLVPEGSHCDFAKIISINPLLSIQDQIPDDIDVVHFQFQPKIGHLTFPYVVTEHGNAKLLEDLDQNTIFVSRNHAERHASSSYVLNGLDWERYGAVDFSQSRSHFHFLGKAAWRLKNVKGAIEIAKKLNDPLYVLGGNRFNFKRGLRLTFTQKAKFFGMVGGQDKLNVLNRSKGLIFPVKWHEPFGLAIIESLYFGCPVFATPYGAIPEIVTSDCGFLGSSAESLLDAIQNNQYDMHQCHHHAMTNFNADQMAQSYLEKYQKVIKGERLNANPPKLLQNSQNLTWTF